MAEIAEFDHEFMTQGSQTAEGEKLAGLIQQNLSPEEQDRLRELWPILDEVTMLIHKAQTGEFPREAQERGLINGQGMPEQGMGDTEVAQNMENAQGAPLQPIEGKLPQNTVNMQGGGSVPEVLQEQQPSSQVAAGPVGVVDKEGADDSGVADDVQTESDGFVINAAAVRHAGLRDINDMIQNAKEYAEKQGIKLNFGKSPVDAEQILVSNGEVVIPDVLANIIGYDRLEKINNRGKKETEQVEKEVKQEQQVAPPPERPVEETKPPVLQAASGLNIGENKEELVQSQEDAIPKFDPDGNRYDTDTHKKVGSPRTLDKRTQKMRGPSAIPINELVEKGIFTEDNIKEYNLPVDGSLLLKGMQHETTPLELEAVEGKYEYKKVPTPLGDRYISFPVVTKEGKVKQSLDDQVSGLI